MKLNSKMEGNKAKEKDKYDQEEKEY